MEMTKQRKLLIAVAGLGLGGLAVDKLLLGPPESAKADVAGVAQQAPVTAPPADQPGDTAGEVEPEVLPSYATLTERLIATADAATDQRPGDPFAMPAGWGPVITDTPSGSEQAQDTEWAKRLLTQYKFFGTTTLQMQGEDIQLAVIRKRDVGQQFAQVGHTIRVETGQTSEQGEKLYELYRLVKIESRKVIWSSIAKPDRAVEMQITVLGEK